MFVTLMKIVPVESSTSNGNGYRPDVFVKKHKTIQSFIDSQAAENNRYKSYLSPDLRVRPSNEFSRIHDDVNDHMRGMNIKFDQSDFDKIQIPRRQPTSDPEFLFDYKPLKSSDYHHQSSPYDRYPFGGPEHQDDGGGGSDGGDGDDGGDGGGDGGGGGGGGNRGAGVGEGDEDGDDGRFSENFDVDESDFDVGNRWKPVHGKYGSNDYFRKPKTVGYDGQRFPTDTSADYRKPPYRKQSLGAYNKKKPTANNRPYNVYEEESQQVFKETMNKRLPAGKSAARGKTGRGGGRAYSGNDKDDDDDFGPSSAVLDDDDADPSPLPSKRSAAAAKKRRQACHKISKSMVPDDIDDHDVIGRQMSCMVCKDLTTGGKFEKCSYKSEPEKPSSKRPPKQLKGGRYHRASEGRRFKRRAARGKRPDSGEEKEVDDYFESTNLDESEEDPDAVAAEYSDDYGGGRNKDKDPENYETAENESDEYSMPVMPESSSTCRKVWKDGNVCNVCQDNLSNRQFEQCEYETVPEKNAYEYSTRNVYGPSRYKRELDDIGDRTTGYDDYFRRLFPELGGTGLRTGASRFSSKDGDFGLLDTGRIGFKRTGPSLLGGGLNDLSLSSSSLGGSSLELDNSSPVNRMLGEFRSKDRSNCKKSLKDKMTCYKCSNGKGAETEECMYVTDSAPTDRKQSYHETKSFNSNPEKSAAATTNGSTAGQQQQQQQQQSVSQSSPAHAYAPLYPGTWFEPAAQHTHVRPYRNRNYRLHRGPGADESVEDDSGSGVDGGDDDDGGGGGGEEPPHHHQQQREEPELAEAQSVEDYDYADDPSSRQVSRHDLPDVDPFGPDGAYSEETAPVFDPTLRTWLPRYMVIKSEEEQLVDAELGLD